MKLKSLLLICLFAATPAYAQVAGSLFVEDMTWQEVRARVSQGYQIAIIPIGGTEQSGPHLATGKHNSIVRFAAADIARQVGGTLVAPVIPYSPAGRIYPPEGHMQFAGTISVRSQTLSLLIEDVADSLRQHGFRLICLVGDNAGSQSIQQQVAQRLSGQWANLGVRVIHVSSYADTEAVRQWAQANGSMARDPVAHAGMAETSQLMAVAPQQVRTGAIGVHSERDFKTTGAAGDATQSSATYGRGFLGVKISASVKEIKEAAARSY